MEIGIVQALGLSVLGLLIVFIVLVLLIGIIKIIALFCQKFIAKPAPVAAPAVSAAAPAPAKTSAPAPGSCGKLTSFSVPDRTAAMVMAITASELNVPLNKLRFISIKEVKE